MQYHDNVYDVTVDLHIRAKVRTSAKSESEAYDNVQNDYENSSLEKFISNYDFEAKDFEMDSAEFVDDPW